MLEQRSSEFPICLGALVFPARQHRGTRCAGFGEAHRPRDRRAQYRQIVAISDIEENIATVGGTRVVEGRQRTEQFEIRVGDLLHVDDRAQELPDAAMRQRLALQGHDHVVGGGQSVEGQHAQRRRAVDDHHIEVVVGQFGQRPTQGVLTPGPHQQHGLGSGEVDIGRQQCHPLRRLDQRGVRFDVAEQHIVDRHRQLVRIGTQREAQAALGVEVDQQHPLADLGERRTQGGDRGRLGHPALLVGHRQYSGHLTQCSRFGHNR